MTEEQKNQEEGQFFSDNSEKSEDVNVQTEQTQILDSTEQESGSSNEKKTIEEWEKEDSKDNKIKNLWSAVIIIAGLLVGSLFVDFSQLLTRSGYSARALKDADIFQLDGKTWVAYTEAPITVEVLVPNDEDLKDCPDCDPTEVIAWLKQNFPTLVAKRVVSDSEEGKAMIEKYNLKTIPAFVFGDNLANTDFYQNPQVQAIFDEKDGKFVMNSVALGVPVGKYLEMPKIEEDDAILGNPDAPTKMIVFSDFQCPYSKIFFDSYMSMADDYKDDVAFVYKDLPLSFHPQAENAALAGRCAQDQGKFWEMAEALYADQGSKENTSAWDNQEGIEVFSKYAGRIGLNVSEFNSCMKEGKFLDKIKSEEEVAGEFGLTGTPSGFIGDEFVGGALEADQLKQILDEQIEKNQ